MKKIISVFLSFIFCFAGMSKQVFAGNGDPLVEHGDLIDNFRKNEKCALKDRQPKLDIGIPVSFIREPGFVESTYGSEYREISLYNVPDLLNQRCDDKSSESNYKSFLIVFKNALEKVIGETKKLQEVAKKSKKNLDGFFNLAAGLLKDSTDVKNLADALQSPVSVIIMALVHAVLWATDRFGVPYKPASAILQTLGIAASTIGSYLLGSAFYGWAFGKAATAVKVVGDTKEAIEKAKKAAEIAEAARKAGILSKAKLGAGFLFGGAIGGIGGGAIILKKEKSIEQRLLRERILNYSNLFRILMEKITEKKEELMQSNLLVVAIDKRNFWNCLYWNDYRKNHGAWISFETIKDLKCSPCANVCKTKDGYTMEKYIEEVTALLKEVDYKKYLVEFEEPKDNGIENGMEKEEKDVDKESMCVCF